jgi:hypothetical protein
MNVAVQGPDFCPPPPRYTYIHTYMALGSTQPLTELGNRNVPGGKERPASKADNLTAICEPTV